MFELLVFRPAFGEPTGSPFCVKAMCLLALAEAEWRPVVVNDPRRMPHGKLPVLRDGERLIPDSEAIRAERMPPSSSGIAKATVVSLSSKPRYGPVPSAFSVSMPIEGLGRSAATRRPASASR